ncbi:MAG TPA: DNA replication and repair protein RecF [Candidatus Saccharimonadales bacterium]|nr:DNA replication and repair protein RecF [Candidatus Saccharimonadales bacterium]
MITDIRLQQFRSYMDDSFEFSPGVNIIVGPNGSGKTNLLEALLVVSRGSSYRAKDVDLVAFHKDWARVDVHAGDAVRSMKLVVTPAVSKTYEIDSKVYRRLPLHHTTPIVLFEPNHLMLLSGFPDLRRSYLDDLLEQMHPGFGTTRRAYRRALAQRNALLKKEGTSSRQEMFPWDVRLSELGGTIARHRAELVEHINQSLPTLYANISKAKDDVMMVYHARHPVASYESAMLNKLEADMTLDAQRGFTGTGPHREDFGVLFNGRPADEVASRGELRTAVLCLKIVELSLLEEVRDQKPLLLLDDVFSELDGARRHALTDYLKDYQTFITTTDADVVLQHFTDDCRIIPLTTIGK